MQHGLLLIALICLPAFGQYGPPKLSPEVKDALIKQGKGLSRPCMSCHGLEKSSQWIYPNLGGQSSFYVQKQLKAFRDGGRKDPTMNAMAKNLSDDDIKAIATFYESLK